jgi:hypothetical protein
VLPLAELEVADLAVAPRLEDAFLMRYERLRGTVLALLEPRDGRALETWQVLSVVIEISDARLLLADREPDILEIELRDLVIAEVSTLHVRLESVPVEVEHVQWELVLRLLDQKLVRSDEHMNEENE